MSNVMTRAKAHLHPPAPAKARYVGRVLLCGLAVALLLGPLRGVLALSMAIAIGLVVAFAVLGGVLALLVRRTARELLASQPHLLRLGHRFETTHDDVCVTDVQRTRNGDLTVRLQWQARHHIELDDQGRPLGVTTEGPGSCDWTLAGRLLPGDAELEQLQALVACQLSLTETGQVEPTGPRTTRRVLASSNGVVLDLHE